MRYLTFFYSWTIIRSTWPLDNSVWNNNLFLPRLIQTQMYTDDSLFLPPVPEGWGNTLEEEYPILTECVVITQFWFWFTMVVYEKWIFRSMEQNWGHLSRKWYCRNILYNESIRTVFAVYLGMIQIDIHRFPHRK